MQSHYCTEEHTIITFEGECNWCGMKESVPLTSDEKFRQIMERIEKNARPDITDD